MSATNLKSDAKPVVDVTISAAELAALGLTTANDCKNIAKLDDAIKESSAVIFARYRDIFPMEINLKTGLADITAFCQSIYMTFPDADKSFPEGNPGKPYSWTTADAKHGNRAARGLKAVSKWLHDNIDKLYTVEVAEIDPATGEAKIDEKGQPVVKAVPAFRADVRDDEKEINALINAMTLLLNSPRISAEFKHAVKPHFTEESARLRPELAKAQAEHEELVKSRKEALAPETDEETETVDTVVDVAV